MSRSEDETPTLVTAPPRTTGPNAGEKPTPTPTLPPPGEPAEKKKKPGKKK